MDPMGPPQSSSLANTGMARAPSAGSLRRAAGLWRAQRRAWLAGLEPGSADGLATKPDMPAPAPQPDGRGRDIGQVITGFLRAAVPQELGLNALQAYYRTLGFPPPCTCEGGVAADDSDLRPVAEQFPLASGIFDDVERLGIGTVRHPGAIDLTWPKLTGSKCTAMPASVASLELLVLSAANVAKLTALLSQLLERGQRVVLTFFTYGGGSDAVGVSDAYQSAVQMCWAEEHEDLGRAPDGDVWHYFDGRFYDKHWMRETAVACATLLATVRSILRGSRSGFELRDAIAGIEIFNEVSVRGVVYGSDGTLDTQTTAETWADNIAWAVDGFEQGLQDAGIEGPGYPASVTRCGVACLFVRFAAAFSSQRALRVLAHPVARRLVERIGYAALPGNLVRFPGYRLPGLASYGEGRYEPSNSAHTFGYRATFFFYLLQALAHDYGEKLQHYPGVQAFVGADYHWYHRGKRRSAVGGYDVQHIGMLVEEVRILRSYLDAFGMYECELTVFENGVDVLTDGSVSHYLPADLAVSADTAAAVQKRGRDAAENETFQAHELWRRVCGALAAGADVAGWHSWMSASVGSFQGMGLRWDIDTATGRTSETSDERLSWLCMHRLGLLAAHTRSVQMVLPELDPAATLRAYEAWVPDKDDDLVVFELELTGFDSTLLLSSGTGTRLFKYAYVVFVDPWQGTAWRCVDVGSKGGAASRMWEFPTMPSAVVRPDLDDVATTSLPLASARYDAPTSNAVPCSMGLYSKDAPRLVLSHARLSWVVGACVVTDAPGERELERGRR